MMKPDHDFSERLLSYLSLDVENEKTTKELTALQQIRSFSEQHNLFRMDSVAVSKAICSLLCCF